MNALSFMTLFILVMSPIAVLIVGAMWLIDRHLKKFYGVRRESDKLRGFEVIEKID